MLLAAAWTPTTSFYVAGIRRPSFVAPSPCPPITCCASTERSCFLQVDRVSYRPPGTEVNLLDSVSLQLSQNSLGLIFGRSGSGKTTLLQVLAGLASPTEGSVTINTQIENQDQHPLSNQHTGIVFQFPERYFLTDSVLEELTFGLPTRSRDPLLTHQLFLQLHQVALAVGLSAIPWDANPRSLSDGYKRRLALAVQLVRKPRLLLLDEPLAGLDWRARIDIVNVLAGLKKELTLLVVSHDLKELEPVVDKAWQMDLGGQLREASKYFLTTA